MIAVVDWFCLDTGAVSEGDGESDEDDPEDGGTDESVDDDDMVGRCPVPLLVSFWDSWLNAIK